jgi:hypothetical protein
MSGRRPGTDAARSGDATRDRVRRPDVELGATVRAASLRFGSEPEVDVGFSGDTERETISGSERRNLPEEVEPGVTYRDVSVRWRAAAWIHPDVDDGAANRGDNDTEGSS